MATDVFVRPNESLAGLCRKAYAAYPRGVSNDYLEFKDEVERALTTFRGVKTDLVLVSPHLVAERIKLSVILSDFSSLYVKTGLLAGIDHGSIDEWPRQLAGLVGPVHGHAWRKTRVRYEFPYWSEVDLDEIEPLITSGRLMLRPYPQLVVKRDDGEEDYVVIEPGSPAEHLLLHKTVRSSIATPLRDDSARTNDERQLLDMTVPFIEHVSCADLARILDDENHVVADFRSSVQSLLREARKDPARATDVFNDTARPAVGKVERRFKTITRMHSLRAAGAVLSACAVTLAAFTDDGIVSSIAKVLGPAGLGLVGKEWADYLKSRADLKETPFYLLWRLGRKKSRK